MPLETTTAIQDHWLSSDWTKSTKRANQPTIGDSIHFTAQNLTSTDGWFCFGLTRCQHCLVCSQNCKKTTSWETVPLASATLKSKTTQDAHVAGEISCCWYRGLLWVDAHDRINDFLPSSSCVKAYRTHRFFLCRVPVVFVCGVLLLSMVWGHVAYETASRKYASC